MSSYHTSFTYLNKNSSKDFGWVIVHFEADSGETDSYMTQEQIFTDSYRGARRILYGTRWAEVALVKITVMKRNGHDFSTTDCRNAYKWLTGNCQANWLDLYCGERLKYSFTGTVQDVKPQKMDARTVGLNIYFESISPWAYSSQQYIGHSINQSLSIDENGTIYSTHDNLALDVNDGGVLYNTTTADGTINIADNGLIDPSGDFNLTINNQTDDLYSYVYLDTTITNYNGESILITNKTTGEQTKISNMNTNEVITLSSGQFILSDKPNKIFGNTFNFVWPRMVPGVNEFNISMSGSGYVYFTYRYPIKIGDCAIDIDVENYGFCCDDYSPESGGDVVSVSWDDITNTPTTIEGYGITNAYNMVEVDTKIENVDANVDAEALDDMLADMFNE